MLDMAIVLLQIGDEATEDQEVRDGATKPTPEPIPSTRLLIGTTNVQEPVPNHIVTLATLFVIRRDPPGPNKRHALERPWLQSDGSRS